MELLKKLSSASGVSGSEKEVANIIKEELEKYVDEIEIDHMGNVIATKKGKKNAPSIFLDAHMDEIGLMVKYIDKNGFIFFTTVGGINDQMLMNQSVTFRTKIGDVMGIIGSKPIHLMDTDERNRIIKSRDMFIDIGTSSKEETEELINIGDVATINGVYSESAPGYILGKALDDRVGCYILVEVMKRIKSSATVHAVGTVQEEVGLKGAKVSSFKLNPDYAIALDVTPTGDYPGISLKEANVKIGKGPAIIVADGGGRGLIANRDLNAKFKKIAEENNIQVQFEISDSGTTDGMQIHLNREGIPTTGVSIPTRYIHTPVSVCYKSDIEEAIVLLVEFINNF